MPFQTLRAHGYYWLKPDKFHPVEAVLEVPLDRLTPSAFRIQYTTLPSAGLFQIRSAVPSALMSPMYASVQPTAAVPLLTAERFVPLVFKNQTFALACAVLNHIKSGT